MTYETENGIYYLIYLDEDDKITVNNKDIYGFVGIDEEGNLKNIKNDFTSLQTLLGKDYYVVLRPAMTEKIIDKIEVATEPIKTEYLEGENFDKSGMKIIAIYNDNTSKEITDYVITDGNNMPKGKTSVTISYTEGIVTKTVEQRIKVLEKLKIEFEDYKELNEAEKRYLEKIDPETTLEEFITKIKTNGKIQIFKDNAEVTNNAIKIATGMKVKISLNNEVFEYTIVVKGDTNGDGECDLKDLLQVNKHRLNKIQLKDEYLLAGDVNKDNTVDLKDILQINKFRFGKIKSL